MGEKKRGGLVLGLTHPTATTTHPTGSGATRLGKVKPPPSHPKTQVLIQLLRSFMSWEDSCDKV